MLLFDGGFALILFAVWIFCIIDVITTPDGATRNLPKMAWLLLVIILVDVGSLAWLVAGRPWNSQQANVPYKGNLGRREPAAPQRMNGTNPDDDEEFLTRLRDRAEEQRRRAREQPDQRSGDDNPGG
jgi:hypothetical protein